MPEMDAAADEELRELRARAYGPHADIATDPAAVRRLQELESSRSTASGRRRPGDHAAIADSAAGGEAAELRIVHPSADASSASGDLLDRLGDESTWEETVAPDAPSDEPERPGRLTRWCAPLWVASVVVAAALAAVITYAFASIPSVSSTAGAPQVATLELTRAGVIPPGWFGADNETASAEFAGMTVFTNPGWYSDSGQRSSESRCLNVVRSDQVPETADFTETSWSFEGQMYSACGVGEFPASVALPFDAGISDELAERYPEGAALQFVLDGDRVAVFLDSGSD